MCFLDLECREKPLANVLAVYATPPRHFVGIAESEGVNYCMMFSPGFMQIEDDRCTQADIPLRGISEGAQHSAVVRPGTRCEQLLVKRIVRLAKGFYV